MSSGRRNGRVLAADFGLARIGVAISDEDASLATPLATIRAKPRGDAVEAVASLVREHRVVEIVVGRPRRLDGSPGTLEAEVEAFARRLRERCGVRVELSDEALSTAEAASRLLAAGRSRSRRRELIDRAAAAVILQDYLDRRRGR